jgi:hypothetical protein
MTDASAPPRDDAVRPVVVMFIKKALDFFLELFRC